MLLLPAELTHDQAAACCRMLTQSLRSHPDAAVVADAGALARFDSSALAVLLALKRRATVERIPLTFDAIPAALDSLARVYGVEALLTS